jgi:hypothetical protein
MLDVATVSILSLLRLIVRKEVSMSTTIPGGYTDWQFPVTSEASEVFKTAFEGVCGVEYTPLAFATQVVAGTKYAFLAEGHVVVPEEPKLVAVIHIIEPLEGKPHILEIKQIPPSY